MNSDKLLTILGGNPFAPWPYHEDLLPLDRDWHRARSEEEPGSRELVIARLYEYPGSKNEQPARAPVESGILFQCHQGCTRATRSVRRSLNAELPPGDLDPR